MSADEASRTGSRRLRIEEISFEDDILLERSSLNFYIPVYFDPEEVFGIQLREDESINVYIDYDPNKQRVCDALEVLVISPDSCESCYQYLLSEFEKLELESKMDSYCQSRYGQSLAELSVECQQEQRGLEMQM